MFRVVTTLIAAVLMIVPISVAEAAGGTTPPTTGWQTPPEEVMEVLHAPQLPWVWTSPTGEHLLLADPVTYPPLAELAAPMHKLAGMRVDPVVGNIHGRHGATSPRLVAVEVRHADHMGLWVGSINGDLKKVEKVAVNQLLGDGVKWLPDQKRLLAQAAGHPFRSRDPRGQGRQVPLHLRVPQPARNRPRRCPLLLLRHVRAGGGGP